MSILQCPHNHPKLYKSIWILFLLSISLTFSPFFAQAQSNGWYTAKQIGEKTWQLNERGIVNSYLIEGTDSALLIDAGFGVTNLRDFVKSLTQKPLIVVNTHEHPDHVGGNYQFDKVYIAGQDLEKARGYLDPKNMKLVTDMILKDITVPDSLKFTNTGNAEKTVLIPIQDGYIFKLGNRDIKVITVPGHTPGSICLLDEQQKLLFTGDNNSPEVWLFFEESLSVSIYHQSIQKLNSSQNKFITMWPGHGPALSKDILDELIQCSELILNGNCETKPHTTFLGSGTACSHKTVTVVYDPKKIK